MPKIVPKSVQTCFEVVLGWFFREKFLPSVPWRVESSKSFKKIKKFSKFQKCPKSSPKVSKRVLNMFWGDFLGKFFRPVFHGGSSLRKFSKKSKNFQNSKNAQNRSQKCPNVFRRCFRVIFSIFFLPSMSMEGRVFENFQKNQKSFKISKMPKIVPKSVQTKFFKIKKNFKIPKKPKIVLKSVQTCFEHVLRWFFRKKKFAQCSMEGRVFENFQKNQKSFKIPKMPKIVPKSVQTKFFKNKKIFKNPNMPKIVPKSVQTCFEDVLGWFFGKNFLPSVPWRVESSKNFEKIKKVSKFQKCPKSSPKKSKRKFSKSKNFSKLQKSPKSFPKLSKRVLNMFWGDFLEKNLCPVFHGGSSLRKFSKKIQKFSKF